MTSPAAKLLTREGLLLMWDRDTAHTLTVARMIIDRYLRTKDFR